MGCVEQIYLMNKLTKMKITLITQYYKPEMGAPQNRLFEMCDGLKKNGCDISIITGMPNYPTGEIFLKYKGKFYCKEEVDGIEVLRYWLYASNARKIMPRIWNMISFTLTVLMSLFYLIKRKNDFIIVESPPLTLALSGYILAKLSGAKLITNISDLWPLSAKELGAMRENSISYKVLEKIELFLYRKSVLVMGQSQEIVDYIASKGANDVYLFRNGVDPTRFNDIVKYEKNLNVTKIVYTGLLGFAQGVSGICKNINFRELGAEFHIYGAGGEQNEIELFLKENPNNGIYYHGKVSREEIPKVLMQADCTLIPLVKNIFGAVPSKIYESMAAGLPILFSGEGEGKYIVESNELGWTSSSLDYESLKENLKNLNSHPEVIEAKRNNCKECAVNKFNRPKQVLALYAYLENIQNKL